MNATLLEALNWRYATKRFDPDKKIPEVTFHVLLESIRLTPTSYGLQPIKIINIVNPFLRAQIKPIAWNQQQVVDASHLLVFCYLVNPGEREVQAHVERMAELRQKPLESFDGFKNHVLRALETMGNEQREIWTSKQTYIALGQLLLACALEKIDATPMEGFDPEALNALLELPQQGYKASLLCPVGYRHKDDPYNSMPKVRKSMDDMYESL